jgi:hypothetical protein
LLRAGRVSFEPLRDLEQILDLSQARDGLSDLREWLTIFLQEAQRALARSIVAGDQEVELARPFAENPAHQFAAHVEVLAFTPFGVENLLEMIAIERDRQT